MTYQRALGTMLLSLGFDPRKIFRSALGLPVFFFHFIRLMKEKINGAGAGFSLRALPVLSDYKENSGVAKGHYFHQDLWAAREVFKNKPRLHVDVGSRIDGFVAHILTFMECTVIDVRSLESSVDGMHYKQQNMMEPDKISAVSDSVSCLHALEHFGLGRYNDPIDLDGWKKGFDAISRLVATAGRLYLSVPIGPQLVEFNAQRIFNPKTIVSESRNHRLELVCFSFIDDSGDFHPNARLEEAANCQYGCGCFEFLKL